MDNEEITLIEPEFVVKGNTLTITITLDGPTKPSKTGKNNLIASYSERLATGETVAGNVYRKA